MRSIPTGERPRLPPPRVGLGTVAPRYGVAGHAFSIGTNATKIDRTRRGKMWESAGKPATGPELLGGVGSRSPLDLDTGSVHAFAAAPATDDCHVVDEHH